MALNTKLFWLLTSLISLGFRYQTPLVILALVMLVFYMSVRNCGRCNIRSVALWDWPALKFLTQFRWVSKRKELMRNREGRHEKRQECFLLRWVLPGWLRDWSALQQHRLCPWRAQACSPGPRLPGASAPGGAGLLHCPLWPGGKQGWTDEGQASSKWAKLFLWVKEHF